MLRSVYRLASSELLVAAEPGRGLDLLRAARSPEERAGRQGESENEQNNERRGGRVERHAVEARRADAQDGDRTAGSRPRPRLPARRKPSDRPRAARMSEYEENGNSPWTRQTTARTILGASIEPGTSRICLPTFHSVAGRGEGHAEELDVAGQGHGAREQGDDAEKDQERASRFRQEVSSR